MERWTSSSKQPVLNLKLSGSHLGHSWSQTFLAPYKASFQA
eukprot:CAMPEP_0202958324 /NCGR_PEP_ID=MMETSP1396-20130829/2680_1 /ASSEMBLY_ACC=CAM_ASM_000872 /TAXON_ID= /ORGANISM="Pseudokeronopsis sp., Strain Brazil" /LENGTH=40 /DNA_ID= /DNA_START= /DNA_END= /DNA_ORIENTATION=